ncbi:MAG TPA: FtsX-like permease family protein [Acidimicrobiia bacterium]|nr:FtsX-like permease family protein [Acidimicrobiia bacterium]
MSNRTTGFAGLVGLGLRRLRIDLTVVIVLALLVALTAFGLTAMPRFISSTSDRALATLVEETGPQRRNLTFSRIGRILPGADGPFARVEAQGDELASELGDTLRSVIQGSNYVVTSAPLELRPLPAEPQAPLSRWFRFRRQSDIDSEVSLIAGVLPGPAEPIDIPVPPCEVASGEPDCETAELAVFQTAITPETADALRVDVGDLVHLRPDIGSPLNAQLPLSRLDYELVLEISGIIELSDPSRDIWNGDNRLHEPVLIQTPVAGFFVFGMGLLADDDYPRLVNEVAPSRFAYEWRYFLDYDQIDSANVGEIGAEISQLSLLYESRAAFESPIFRTGVDDLASRLVREARAGISFSSLVLVGLLGVVITVTLVLAAVAAKRREQSTILVRSRGADPPRVMLARFTESLVVFVPAAALGIATARVLVPGRDAVDPILTALLVAVGLALVFVVASLPSVVGDLGTLLTRRLKRMAGARRIVIEVLIIVIAAGAAILVRRRGIDPDISGFDPILAATPLLIGLAVGVVLIRFAPLAARLASSVGSRVRGVVGMIGFRELAGRPLSAQLPSVVILIGLAIGIFGLVQIDTVEHAQIVGSWQTVGANYRVEPNVEGSSLSPELSTDFDYVDATADATILDGQTVDAGVRRGNIQVLAVDVAEYATVGDGTPADPRFPGSMLATVTPAASGDTIPAIISSRWPIRRPAVGDVIQLGLGRAEVEIVVADIRNSFPGLEPDRQFVVVDRETLGSVSDEMDVAATRRYIDAPDTVSAELTEGIESQFRSAGLVSRPDLLEAISETPTMTGIELINAIALVLATALAAVVAVSGFAVTARERTRDLGYMRAIGLTRRQMAWAIITEQLPLALLAALLGIAAGVGAAFLVEPALDVTALTATTLDTGVVVDWASIAVVSLSVVGSVLVATAIYSYSRRDLDLANVLRRDERV